jgi:hypothetical protein
MILKAPSGKASQGISPTGLANALTCTCDHQVITA